MLHCYEFDHYNTEVCFTLGYAMLKGNFIYQNNEIKVRPANIHKEVGLNRSITFAMK